MFVTKTVSRSIHTHTRQVWASRVKHLTHTVVVGLAVATVGITALQLVYPPSLALPRTRVGGKSYSFQPQLQIAADIARLNDQKLQIHTGEKTLTHTPKEIGLMLDGIKDAQTATQYSWRERLTPFSFFFEHRDVPHYSYHTDEAKAHAFAASLSQYDRAPVDAMVKLEGTNVVVQKQQTGFAYDATATVEALKDLQLTSSMNMSLTPKLVDPNISDHTAAEAASILQQRLQKPLVIQANGKSMTADPPILASWTVLTPDPQHKKLSVTYDREKVKQALAHFANQVYVPPTPRTVTLVDGVSTGDNQPADGKALDMEPSADAVIAAATANQPQVEAKIKPVVAAARVIRNYTRSSNGLQALINYWAQSNGGQWGIVMKDFSGTIAASHNGNRQFTSASVYKIYVAYVTYTKVDNGEFGMETPTSNGNNVSGCLELMIVRSDNACGAALGNMIGWSGSNGMVHAKGFGSTSLSNGNQLTTANDAATYMITLQNGGLLSAGNRQALLSKLGRQVWRYGIPAGSPGMHVANKLGTVGNYNHDVGIVYHPKGAYVLSVFTYGSNHARIRELARQVAAVMSQ